MSKYKIEMLIDALAAVCIINLLELLPSDISYITISYMICYLLLRNRRK